MGIYLKKNLGIEVGMNVLTNGVYMTHTARMTNLHSALKALLPINDMSFLYAKLGVGTSLGQGMYDEEKKTINFMTTNVGPY